MAKLLFKHSESAYGKFRVFIQDTTSAVGAGLTGLTFSTSGLSIHTIADNEASVTSYTAAGSTIETITTLGTFAAPTATKCRFKEIDSTNLPGWYEIQVADARWAVSGARAVQVRIAVTGGFCAPVEIQLALFDVNDTVRGGMTALPNAAHDAAGGLTTLLNAIDDYLDTEIAAIKAKTDNLPTDPADQSAVEAAITAAQMTAAGIRAAIGMAFADLDTQLTNLVADVQQVDIQVDNVYLDTNVTIPGLLNTIDDFLDTEVAAIKAKTDNLPAAPAATGDIPTAAQIATRVLDTEEMETGYSLRKALKFFLSLFGGKSSGFPTSPVFRDINDTKNRVSATLDGDGNRTAVTIDVT